VDPPDENPDYISEDLSVNEMESITEIICEQVLHLDNLFPEHDEHDNDDRGSALAHHLMLTFYKQPISLTISSPYIASLPMYLKRNEYFISQYSSDVLIPPPKA
jgi:hypothetical protein